MAESHREEIAKLEALYASNPGGRVFVHLAEAYRKAGEHERARTIVSEGLARHADSASGYVVLGRVLADMQNAAEAEIAFRRVLELDGGNLVALRWLGDLARLGGRSEEAAGYYREVLARNPNNEEVRELADAMARAAVAEAAAAPEPEPEPEPASPYSAAPGDAGSAAPAEVEFGLVDLEALPGDLATFAGLPAPEAAATSGAEPEPMDWSAPEAAEDLLIEAVGADEPALDLGDFDAALVAEPLDVSLLDAAPFPRDEDGLAGDLAFDLPGVDEPVTGSAGESEPAPLFEAGIEQPDTAETGLELDVSGVAGEEFAAAPDTGWTGVDEATVENTGWTGVEVTVENTGWTGVEVTVEDAGWTGVEVTVEDAGWTPDADDEIAPVEDAGWTPDGDDAIAPVGEAGWTPGADDEIAPVGEAGWTPGADDEVAPIDESGWTADAAAGSSSDADAALEEPIPAEPFHLQEPAHTDPADIGFQAPTEPGTDPALATGAPWEEGLPDDFATADDWAVAEAPPPQDAEPDEPIQPAGTAAGAMDDVAVGYDDALGGPVTGQGSGLMTETTAQLYASQGFHDRAAEVYRALLRQRPGDDRLAARLQEAEGLVRAAAGGEVESLVEEDESGEVWLRDARTSGAAEAATPYAWTGPADEEAQGEPIGALLRSILSWRAPAAAPAAMEAAAVEPEPLMLEELADEEPWEEPASAAAAPSSDAEPPVPPAPPVPPPAWESAAPADEPWTQAPAPAPAAEEPWAAPGSAPGAGTESAPPPATAAAPAAPPVPPPAPTPVARSTRASDNPVEAAFDEWFGAPEPAAPAAPAPQAEEEGQDDEDLEMFRSWLQSLKK